MALSGKLDEVGEADRWIWERLGHIWERLGCWTGSSQQPRRLIKTQILLAENLLEQGVGGALCSLGTGSLLSGYVSSLLLHDSGVAPLESLQVEALPPEQTLLIMLLGCAVIAIALAVSCAAVLAKSPKSILSSMR